MIRIRFHGRGGHGVKTASRIVGTAAFHAGFQCQDSPVYGAERRGAAVVAFTRFAQQPIRERGVIPRPDMIVVADETLLRDPAAGVLGGGQSATALFVNTADPARLELTDDQRARLTTFDLTGRTLAVLGRAAALSAGLGAVAARLTGVIPVEQLLEGLREELESLGISPAEIAKNEQIAREIFATVEPASFAQASLAQASPAPALPGVGGVGAATSPADGVIRFPTLDVVSSTPSILASGNAASRHTGAWRLERPTIDHSLCTRCGMCFVMCPDGAVSLDANGYPVIDYDHCKGCLICQRICPAQAVEKERETQAW